MLFNNSFEEDRHPRLQGRGLAGVYKARDLQRATAGQDRTVAGESVTTVDKLHPALCRSSFVGIFMAQVLKFLTMNT